MGLAVAFPLGLGVLLPLVPTLILMTMALLVAVVGAILAGRAVARGLGRLREVLGLLAAGAAAAISVQCLLWMTDPVKRDFYTCVHEADTLEHLGGVHHGAGDIDAAHWAWTQAVRIFDEIDHPGGDRVRAKLRNRDDQAASDGVVSQALDRHAESLA